MTADRDTRVYDLFVAALAVAPGDRDDYLGRECGDDTDLRDEVARLLGHCDADTRGHFLATPLLAPPTPQGADTPGPGELPEPRLSGDTGRGESETDVSADGLDFLAPAERPDELGRLGGYRVLKVLGAGGMGVVLDAEDPRLGRHVAIKVMRPSVASNARARDRFLREAKAAATVEHDHIVAILHIGEDRGVPYIVMPFLKGESLDARLKRDGPLPASDILRIGREVAEGLAAAHALGLVHRDIKPANLWLETPRGRVKVLDFGLARLNSDAGQLTQSGAIVGTPAYMAPEQARGQGVDQRCDLFSLGAVLYRMATGRTPFAGTDTMSILMSLASDTPAHPRSLNPDLPVPLADLIVRLLQKDPAKRPQTAREVARLLAPVPMVEAMPSDSGERRAEFDFHGDDATQPDEVPMATAAEPVASPKRSRRGLLVAVSTTVLLLIGSGGLAAYKLVFESKDGTLVVEMADKNTEARFKNGELQILDADGNVKYTLTPSERNKAVAPGDYKVRVVAADGAELFTDEFTMKRRGEVVVRVTAKPVAIVAKKDPPPPDPVLPAVPEPGPSVFDTLDASKVPAALKFPDMPKEVVAAVGARNAFVPTAYTRAPVLSPDGKWVEMFVHDSGHYVWDTATLTPHFYPLGRPGVAFSADSRRLVLANTISVRLIDLTGPVPRQVKEFARIKENGLDSLAFFPDGKRIAVGGGSGGLFIWDIDGDDKPTETLLTPDYSKSPFGQHSVNAVTISDDGRRLAARSIANRPDAKTDIRIWDVSVTPARLLHRLPAVHINCTRPPFVFTPDGKTLIEGAFNDLSPKDQRRIAVWDVSGESPRLLAADPVIDPKPNQVIVVQGWTDGGESILVDRGEVAPAEVWAYKSGLKKVRELPKDVRTISADGKRMVRIDRQRLRILDGEAKVLASGTEPVGDPYLSQPVQIGDRLMTKAIDWNSFVVGDRALVADAGWPALNKEMPYAGLHGRRLSPDGRWLAIQGGASIQLLPIDRGRLLPLDREMTLSPGLSNDRPGHHFAMAWRPDGRVLATAHVTGVIDLWDVTVRPPARKTFRTLKGFPHLCWHPDGNRLVTVTGKEVQVWKTSQPALNPQVLPVPEGCVPSTAAVEPDGTGVWVGFLRGGEQPVYRYALNLPNTPAELAFPDAGNGLLLSPTGRLLATFHATTGWSFWDTASRKRVSSWAAAPFTNDSGRWTDDGRHFLVTHYGAVYVLRLAGPPSPPVIPQAGPSAFDVLDASKVPADLKFPDMPKQVVGAMGALRGVIPTHGSSGHQISPDGKWAVAQVWPVGHCIWDTATLTPQFLASNRQGSAFSPDSRWLVTGTANFVHLIDLTGPVPKPVKEFAHIRENGLSGLAFFPDSKRLAVGGGSGGLFIWDVDTKDDKPLETLMKPDYSKSGFGQIGVESVVVSADGRRLAAWCVNTGGDAGGSIRVWDVSAAPAKLLHTLPAHRFSNGPPTPLVLSPDGRTLIEGHFHPATPKENRRVAVWDISGTEPKQLAADPVHTADPIPGIAVLGWAEPGESVLIQKEWTENSVEVWSFKGGLKKVRDLPKNVLAVSTGGKRMVQIDRSRIAILDADGKPVKEAQTPNIGFHEQPVLVGDRIYSSRSEWRSAVLQDGRIVDEGPAVALDKASRNLAFRDSSVSPDGRWLAGWHAQSSVLSLCPIEKGRLLPPDAEMEISRRNPNSPPEYEGDNVRSFAWRPGSSAVVITLTSGAIDLWDTTKRPPTRTPIGIQPGQTRVAWSRDGSQLITVSGSKLNLWDMTKATPVARPLPVTEGFKAVTAAFEADGTGLWVAYWSPTSRPIYRFALNRPNTPAELVFPNGGSHVNLSPSGRLLSAYHPVDGWRFWDLDSRKQVGDWTAGPHSEHSGRWAADGRHFLVTHYGAVYVLRLRGE